MKSKIFILAFLAIFMLTSMVLSGKEEPGGAKKVEKAQISWYRLDEGMKLAKERDKKLFVQFTTDWCGWCKKMKATTFKDAEIIDFIDKYYIAVSVNGESKDSLNLDGWITTEKQVTKEFGVRSYPTFWFLTSDNERIAPMKGYRDKDGLFDILDYLKDDLYKTTDFKAFMAQRKKK